MTSRIGCANRVFTISEVVPWASSNRRYVTRINRVYLRSIIGQHGSLTFPVILFGLVLFLVTFAQANGSDSYFAFVKNGGVKVIDFDSQKSRLQGIQDDNIHFSSIYELDDYLPESPKDSSFKHYLRHLSTSMQETLGQMDPDNELTLNITVVKLPPIAKNQDVDRISKELLKYHSPKENGRSIISPFATVVMYDELNLIDAVFVWSPRQQLIDQLILAGIPTFKEKEATVDRSLIALPFPLTSYNLYENEYASALANGRSYQKSDNSLVFDELTNGVDVDLPEDYFWLFNNSPQSLRSPFSQVVKPTFSKFLLLNSGNAATYSNSIFKSIFEQKTQNLVIREISELIRFNQFKSTNLIRLKDMR